MTNNRLNHRLALIAISLFSIVYIARVVVHPYAYWDLLPYMGAVVSHEQEHPGDIHTTTFTAFKQHAPQAVQHQLLETHPFCRENATNPDFFRQQLPYYSVKFGYIQVCRLFYTCGVPLYYAVLLTGWIAVAGCIWLLFLLAARFMQPLAAAFVTGAVCLLEMNRYVFSIASPDALTALFLLLALYAFIRNKPITAHVMLLLTCVIRPEYLVFQLLFSGYLLVKNRHRLERRHAIMAGITVISAVVACGIVAVFEYDSHKMFYRSFIDLYPSGGQRIDWALYSSGLQSGIRQSLASGGTFLFLSSIPLLVVVWKRLHPVLRIVCALLLISIFLRFLLHPLLNERFVFIYVNVFLITVLHYALNRTGLTRIGHPATTP